MGTVDPIKHLDPLVELVNRLYFLLNLVKVAYLLADINKVLYVQRSYSLAIAFLRDPSVQFSNGIVEFDP